jgi:hypothetical protein
MVLKSDQEYLDFLAHNQGSLDTRHGDGHVKKAKKRDRELFQLLSAPQIVPAEFIEALPYLVQGVGYHLSGTDKALPEISIKGKKLDEKEFCNRLAENYYATMNLNRDKVEGHQKDLLKKKGEKDDATRNWLYGVLYAPISLQHNHPLHKRDADWIAINPWVWTHEEIISQKSAHLASFFMLNIVRDAPGRDDEWVGEYKKEKALLVRHQTKDCKSAAIVKFNDNAEIDFVFSATLPKPEKGKSYEKTGDRTLAFLHKPMNGEEEYRYPYMQDLGEALKPIVSGFQEKLKLA